MNRNSKRFLALILVLVAVFATAVPAFATSDADEPQRASDYISYVYAHTSVSGGSVNVYFAIMGTGPMDSLGATDIMIFNSHNSCVAILDDTNTTGLMGYNQGYYSNTISWPYAVSGERYRAIVGYKSEKDGGYDTTSYQTNWAP